MFSGALNGNAATATTAASCSGNSATASTSTKVTSTYTNTASAVFLNGNLTVSTASKDLYHTNAVYMTPSNDYLYAARFVGPLTGAVTGNASTSTQVYVTSTATSTDYRLIFGENNDGGNAYESLYKDSGASLYYNPSTNRLYAEHIQGEGSLITNINYSNIYNPPSIGNGTITIDPDSHIKINDSLTANQTFTMNQANNETIKIIDLVNDNAMIA